ncbi:alpha/beta-hydrolase [Penicillium atrosanguineum]|uniref:Alpha/beta-hydrolase n=1 Tax=Penicillium atrosanguineum TaxID=1132637 RepID=A0A9W9U5J9_9EURO|nr:alpha/beta-hydrolase [Penicillium atrosanguineum]KAJ5320936.1 alpha/beta-hydrolase [Penicillium atrosanguineum]
MSNLPTLVFVPGSWHRPTCFDPVIKLLPPKLKCIAVSLPSTTGNPAATFKDDLDAVQSVVSRETVAGRDVVVIAHSYGGMVGNSAVKGFTQNAKDEAQSSKGYVIGIILIASGFTLTGMAFMDPFFGHPPPTWRVNNETGYAELVTPPRQLFYHDLPEGEAEYWTSQLTTQSLKALFEGGEYTYAGWQDVPSWYIGTIEDQGLPVLAQRMTVGMARELGGKVEHRELQTSHSPFLSQPEATVKIMVEAVEAFIGKVIDESPSGSGSGSGSGDLVALPEARLLQPLTWFSFGLPLAFGHVLGRSYLFFCWGRRLWRSGLSGSC